MTSLRVFDRSFRLFGMRFFIGAIAFLLFGPNPTMAQSTFGTLVGTVKDTSGAVVPNGAVTVDNTGTAAHRTTLTDAQGAYEVTNLEPGSYTVKVEAPGFQVATYQVTLTARETARVDAQMAVAGQATSVTVAADAGAPIETDVSNIAETKSGRELVDLPIAIATRSSGSTSPMSTLTTQPGVQTDASGNISVAGTKPSMLQLSIDGISSMGPRSNGPLTELFPSFNSIAEIRVSEINNSAEYGGISDITTVSKSGTNSYHGGVFENLQNTVLNARNPFSATVPVVKMNDFGGYGGGRIWRDKSFFFASYEGLRLPKQTTIVNTVPSVGLRGGDLSVYSTPVIMPGTNAPFPGNQIPATLISPISLNALKYLFPLPNTGSVNSITNNYVDNMSTPISSDQADLRLDQVIDSKQTVFARGTYKTRQVDIAPGTTAPIGTASLGPFSEPEIDFGFTAAWNYIISPTLINETARRLQRQSYESKFWYSGGSDRDRTRFDRSAARVGLFIRRRRAEFQYRRVQPDRWNRVDVGNERNLPDPRQSDLDPRQTHDQRRCRLPLSDWPFLGCIWELRAWPV